MGQCPQRILRQMPLESQVQNEEENGYTKQRASNVQNAWKAWLMDGSEIGYSSTKPPITVPPVVAMAMAGGGLRGSLFSAGVMTAFDSNNDTAQRKGTGGLIGTALFQTGSAGGSFTFSGIGGFDTFHPGQFIAVPNNTRGALLNMSLVTPGGANVLSPNNQQFFGNIMSNVVSKATAGDTSLADVWGSMVSYHFLNGTTRNNFYTNDTSHGANILFSNLPSQDIYQNFSVPLPIIALNFQVPAGADASSSIIYEITPYEMGSFDPRLSTMAQTKYLGTQLTNGVPANNNSCVTNFDQASFVMGTTSSPFYNALDLDGKSPNTTGFDSDDANALNYLLGKLMAQAKSRRYDVANWPNPFKNISAATFPNSNEDSLSLGGSQNYIPIEQLMVKARNVSVIVVVDSTGEPTENKWPDGTAMILARERISTVLNQTHKAFPPIPETPNDFVQTGVNLRPTFFGCDPTQNPPEWPLIIYIPNAPPADGSAPVTNPTGFKTSYSDLHQQLFFDQAFSSATSGFIPGKLGSDPNFPNCLKCAAVDRGRYVSSASAPVARSQICQGCFTQYCYDSKSPPSKDALPKRQFVFIDPDGQTESFLHRHETQLAIGVAIGAAALLAIIVGL
ncbi:hypothetical protein M422DRAFT_164028 [Sphaerobolus stellatus SS14]|nr:hypothetical protein M422DRAFT_164028 [Sphaerobolus stellatus SS14]